MINNSLTYQVSESRSIGLSCTYVVVTPPTTLAKNAAANLLAQQKRLMRLAGQQRRTLRKKKQFLEVYPDKGYFTVAVTCKIVGIKSRRTVYNWIRDDIDFKQAMEDVVDIQRDFVQDLLMLLIAKGDGPSVRYFLDRRHPDYMRGRLRLNYEKEKKKWNPSNGHPESRQSIDWST